jgi:hypothetical protein
MLIFKLASPTQNNQAWIMVKLFKTVSTTVVEHAKMNRIHEKAEAPFRRYGIFPATSILDKEHVLPDFSSSGKCFFVGNTCSFRLILLSVCIKHRCICIKHRCTTLSHYLDFS